MTGLRPCALLCVHLSFAGLCYHLRQLLLFLLLAASAAIGPTQLGCLGAATCGNTAVRPGPFCRLGKMSSLLSRGRMNCRPGLHCKQPASAVVTAAASAGRLGGATLGSMGLPGCKKKPAAAPGRPLAGWALNGMWRFVTVCVLMPRKHRSSGCLMPSSQPAVNWGHGYARLGLA